MYLPDADKNILKVAREREDFLRSQAYKDKKIETQAAEIESLTSENDRLQKLLESKGITP